MTTGPTKAAGTDWLRQQGKKTGLGEEPSLDQVSTVSMEVERWLQRHQVEYAPPTNVPMTLIDLKRSRANQARRDAIVADSVERFAAAMKTGAVFPPIVVYPYVGKVVIIDGNNRHEAARRASLDVIRGIVVADSTPSELIQLLTVEANASHGVTPELTWRLQQAFHLISIGFSDAQAANASSVTTQQIMLHRKLEDSDRRAKAMRIGSFGELPATARAALAVLKDEAVFFQAAQTAVKTGMFVEDVRDMIRTVRKETSEAGRVAAIGRIAEERGIEAAARKAIGHAPRVSSPKTALSSGIGLIMSCDEGQLARSVLTLKDKELIMKRLKGLEDKVLALLIALDTVHPEPDDDEEV
jgi:ParB-like chromosome segregation protein Spo0J